jgi:prepilin-type processing-associated H-X9-DG protein
VSVESAGFFRGPLNDPAAYRHFNAANYTFADGHCELRDPTTIPCDDTGCQWSIQADPH